MLGREAAERATNSREVFHPAGTEAEELLRKSRRCVTTLIGDYLGKREGCVPSTSSGLQERSHYAANRTVVTLIFPSPRVGYKERCVNFSKNVSCMLLQSSHIAWVTRLTQPLDLNSLSRILFPLTRRGKRGERVVSVLLGSRV